MSTHYRPQGYTTLTPMVVVSPAAEAITFYEQVFGARQTTRMDGPDGSVWHAELDLGTGGLQVMDPNAQFHMVKLDHSTDDVPYPFGVRWSIMTRTVDRTDEEVQRGPDAWAASMEQ